jgi:hypothetical protein
VMDLNLEATPHFTLEEEGGRPVFVEAATVVPGSGRVSVLQSRTHPRFAQVLQLHSGLRSSATQFTLEVRRDVPQKLSLRTSYTASWARDESSFSCCSALQGFGAATTAGDPNRAEFGRSDFERRHSLQATGGLPIRPWLQLTLIGRAVSGAPFTPIVGADINGDGVRNDRAFLFDPATVPDTVVARGMSRLLERSPGRVRSCLEAQLGRIAERNSCFEPWHTSIELRLNAQPQLPGVFGRRLTASLASQNLLIGLDQLVNGTGSLRGWGQRSSPDATLLYPRGFDPAASRFRYEVNERFGDPRQGPIPFGSPFVLHLEGRMELGPRARR